MLEQARGETERLRTESRSEVDRLLADARAKVERTVTEAKNQAAELLAATKAQVAEQENESRLNVERMRTAIEDLHRHRAEYRDRVRELVAEQLSALDRVGEFPDFPSALNDLEQSLQPADAGEEGGDEGWRGPDNSPGRGQTPPIPTRRFDRREAVASRATRVDRRGDRHDNGA